MENIYLSEIASLKINGEHFPLIPEKMNKNGEIFTCTEDGAEFSEEICDFGNAFTVLMRIKSVADKNTGRFSAVKSLDREFSLPGELYYESLNGDDCGAVSFVPIKKKLENTIHAEPFGGRPSDRDAFPFFEVHNGEASYIFAVGWTGQWCADVTKTEKGFRVSVGLTDSDFYLTPGEKVRLPLVLVFKGGEITKTRQDFRAFILKNFTPRPGGKLPEMPIAIQPFDRYFGGSCGSPVNPFWNTEEGQKTEANIAAKCGFDAQWIDASWMKVGFPTGIGNWSYAPGYPNGLKPVSDEVHKHGMRFVIWFEPERIYRDTEVFNEHPEWIITLDESLNCLFNLSDREAAEYLTQKLISKISENGIDVYRQDFNMCPLGYWRKLDAPDRKGITEMHYVENYYKMLDTLFKKFPGLMMDNCSSGGRRLDLEMIKRSVTLWRSDTGCSPEHEGFENTLWNNLQTIVLNRYLPFTCCASWTADDYSVRGVFTGGIALNLDILNENFSPDYVKDIIAECARCKHYWLGRFVQITEPDTDTSKWAAYGLDCGNEGCIYCFRKRNAENEEFTLSPGMFEKNSVYSVKITDENMQVGNIELTGAELENFTVTLKEKRSSMLIEYRIK